MATRTVLAAIAMAVVGCASSRPKTMTTEVETRAAAPTESQSAESAADESSRAVVPAAFEDEPTPSLAPTLQPPGDETAPDAEVEAPPTEPTESARDESAAGELSLEEVIASVYQSYPLLESALQSRTIADGQQLAAAGGFDLKLKAASENGPAGFYQTYRHSIGLMQPVYHGGEVFAGYRIGRGDFEPWYLERQTNDGGEFKAGVAVPLARNRRIDSRRAELWRSTYGRQLVEPDIQAQLIGFVQEASYAYWDWVAAGERYRIVDRILFLAEDRTERIRRQVEVEFLDPPELTDNLRLVAERKAKLADAARKVQQTAVKLSLYYRDLGGQPVIVDPETLPVFPDPTAVTPDDVLFDTQIALEQRPEIGVLNLLQRQLEVDYAEAHNNLRPAIDAVIAGSQDVGLPTSPKNDKGPFVLDASLFVDVPIQRRKPRGKMQQIEGKIAQLSAKRRLTEDKIVADVQTAYAGLMSAYEQVQQARQAVEHAEDLARRERRNLDEGLSDLLKVTLREQYAVESADKVVEAMLLYYRTQADYRAALAQDRLP